jgi:AraC-like DNA-binding protein
VSTEFKTYSPTMENYNKIIESMGVRYVKSRNIKIFKDVTIASYLDVENTIVALNKGDMRIGVDGEVAKEGSLLFIPANKSTRLSYGNGGLKPVSYENFLVNKDSYYEINKGEDVSSLNVDNYTYLNLEAKIFDSVNFFASLDIPAFIIHNEPELLEMVNDTYREDMAKEPGRERVIKINCEKIVIFLIRYILKNRLFVEELATNSTYFKDPRLVNIFSYIKENLAGDLSNKALAQVAQVSEDYVGQYFKMLTGINPQDYIEYQRMEEAVNLLRTTKKSIREIGANVGYKGTAYFCRRFKMMFVKCAAEKA